MKTINLIEVVHMIKKDQLNTNNINLSPYEKFKSLLAAQIKYIISFTLYCQGLSLFLGLFFSCDRTKKELIKNKNKMIEKIENISSEIKEYDSINSG